MQRGEVWVTGQQGGERGSAVGTCGSGSQAGLAGAYPEGGCACLGGVCGDCPLGWDGEIIIFISYVVVPLL